MKSPFSYYGGKQRLARRIASLLPAGEIYGEPCAGGAAVFFAMQPRKIEVLNDTNGEIVNFYRVLQEPDLFAQLERRLQATPYSRAEYERAKTEAFTDPVRRAWAFFAHVQMTYAGDMTPTNGWKICRSIQTANRASIWANAIDRLPEYLERMRAVYVENLDALSCIRKWDSPDTVFYCDPPYPDSDQGHYGGYTQEDFEELVEALSTCQASFVLSCYDNPAVPAHWERFEYQVQCSAKTSAAKNPDRQRTSVLWRVDRSKRGQLALFDLGCVGAS